MSERYTAVLTWMGGDVGYGFSIEMDGLPVFIHYDPAQGEGFQILMEGYKCAFEVIKGRKGLTAAKIYQPNVTPPRREIRP